MTKSLLKDFLGWGIMLWLIGYILGIILFMVVPSTFIGWIILPIGTALTCWVLVQKIRGTSLLSFVLLGICWTLIAIIGDYFFLVKMFHPTDGYYKLDVYFYYALTLLLPLFIGWYKTNVVENPITKKHDAQSSLSSISMKTRSMGILLGIFILGLGGTLFLVFKNTGWLHRRPTQQNNPQNIVNFSHNGNLVRNNPGMSPGVWYIAFEEPGNPARLTQLSFTQNSLCSTSHTQSVPCDLSSFVQGQQALVEGTQIDTTSTPSVQVTHITFVNVSQTNNIHLFSPEPNTMISSPFHITGEARGSWYFEASFPIKLIDAHGNELVRTHAQAQRDWMTDAFVPFTGDLLFTQPTTASGTLILEKDNPSGLPEHSAEVRIPVRFNPQQTTVRLYYYNPKNDVDSSGAIRCSPQGLMAVTREIPKTMTPIQDAIRELLKGALTPEELAQGITTEYPLPGLNLKGAALKDGSLTLEFDDPRNTTSGGSCRIGILWSQIEATAKQFTEVKQVAFKPDTLFQP